MRAAKKRSFFFLSSVVFSLLAGVCLYFYIDTNNVIFLFLIFIWLPAHLNCYIRSNRFLKVRDNNTSLLFRGIAVFSFVFFGNTASGFISHLPNLNNKQQTLDLYRVEGTLLFTMIFVALGYVTSKDLRCEKKTEKGRKILAELFGVASIFSLLLKVFLYVSNKDSLHGFGDFFVNISLAFFAIFATSLKIKLATYGVSWVEFKKQISLFRKSNTF